MVSGLFYWVNKAKSSATQSNPQKKRITHSISFNGLTTSARFEGQNRTERRQESQLILEENWEGFFRNETEAGCRIHCQSNDLKRLSG
ncbi:hypothetical protein Amal_03936 [Acetobacter malorum]|uniref:Uncharacterized protein n=1 Tax=Acetobacter malorum TaxID=178901 RepID=A0A177G3C2_9PROT|nr:hypothetical protein Amal_03936 [Acetobacter malorum]